MVFLGAYTLAFLVISIIPAGSSPPPVRPTATIVTKPVEPPEVFLDDEPTKRVKKFRTLFADHEVRIYNELNTLKDHPWAGRYYLGEELDSSEGITISPNSEVIYKLGSCFPTPCDLNYGIASFNGQYLHIKWQLDTQDKPWFPTKFLLVPWGERRYLVPIGDIIGFCRDVNENLEQQTEHYGYNSWHRVDSKKKISGLPQLPKEFEKYRNMKSINGSIKEAGPVTIASEYGSNKNKTACLAQKVVLDIGEAEAVLPQMRFRLTEENGFRGWITITQVRLHEADAVARFQREAGEPAKSLEVGKKVVTLR